MMGIAYLNEKVLPHLPRAPHLSLLLVTVERARLPVGTAVFKFQGCREEGPEGSEDDVDGRWTAL